MDIRKGDKLMRFSFSPRFRSSRARRRRGTRFVRNSGMPMEQVVKVIEQKPNPAYPKTTPKGGTGKGIWIR
jgi:hypothetical protein